MHEVDKISSLRVSEHVELRSTLHALTNRDFICSTCQSRFKGRQDEAVQIEKWKKVKACEEMSPEPRHFVGQGQIRLKFRSCIGNYFSPSAMHWINLYNAFEGGTMPFQGGYMDQPSKVIDVMNIIGNHKHEEMLKAAKQQKQASRATSMRAARGGQ